jgi:hypothetical protein
VRPAARARRVMEVVIARIVVGAARAVNSRGRESRRPIHHLPTTMARPMVPAPRRGDEG